MFGNNNNMSNGISLIQTEDSVMADSNKPKGPRGRGPNKYNGNSYGKSIAERLGTKPNTTKNRLQDKKTGFRGKDDKKNKLNLYKNNGRPNLKDFHKSSHERVIASNAVGNVQDLEKLIKKKSKKPIKILKAERKSESVVVFFVEHMGHAKAILNLSGMKFNGNTVTFAIQNRNHITTASDIKNSVSIIENLKNLMFTRYNPEAQYLNLDSLNNDPSLGEKKGLIDFNASEKLGQVVCKLIKENFPQVKTISFANNNLRNLKSFSKLHFFLPDLMNLSFQNNQLTTLRDLEPLNGSKFTNLRELVIADNPIKNKELQKFGNFENLKSKIKSMFPSLIMLDQEELPEGISFDVGKDLNSKSLPLQIKSSFIDSEVTGNTVQDFIIKYYTLFDTNRIGLLDLYDDNAVFSLSVNHNSPPWRKYYERGDNMSNWKAFDRNFKTTTRQSNRDNLLIKNKNAIIQTIAKLPSTKHPLEDDSKFIIDSWQINISPQQVLIYLNISGEFKEVDIKLNKSFSRTFLIAPSQPQSNAAKAGWAYTIFNDQLTVRPWSGNKSFDKAEANPIKINISNTVKSMKNNNNNPSTNVFNSAAQVNTNSMNGPLNLTPAQLQEQEQLRIQHGLNDMQHQQVQELCRLTRLTYLYSLQCLNDFQWNFNAALEGFKRVYDQVPPDGYYH